jgi:peptide/histidine transporter 3/4
MSDEDRPLLQNSSHKLAVGASICPAKHLCLPSKAITLIILWTAVVGAMYIIFISAMIVAVTGPKHLKYTFVVLDSIPFTIIAVVMMFYPLGGFMADVCLGRFRVILISLLCIFLSLTLVCVVYLTAIIRHYETGSAFIKEGGTLVVLALLLFTIGLVGYQSNFIQFGLDQLLDAPSHYLGLYIHYAMWAFSFSPALILTGETFLSCSSLKKGAFIFIGLALGVIMVILITILAISWWKRQWFNIQPGLCNPYKTVIKVLHFARNNKYPPQRSAFTYSGIDNPTRLDFAKERYGGPFTTEEVENVKTLFRILSVLLALGPIYTLQLPATVYVFPFLLCIQALHQMYHAVQTLCGQ